MSCVTLASPVHGRECQSESQSRARARDATFESLCEVLDYHNDYVTLWETPLFVKRVRHAGEERAIIRNSLADDTEPRDTAGAAYEVLRNLAEL